MIVPVRAFLAGFLIGGLVGAATALLLAPQSGEDTRKYIQDKSIEIKSSAAEMADETRVKIEAAAEQARQRVETAAEQARVKAEEAATEARARVDEIKKMSQETIQKAMPTKEEEETSKA